MSAKRRFTPGQIRAIKTNLVEGVTMVALARTYQCSLSTIQSIKNGTTYGEIRVLGEEKLRPPVEMVSMPKDKVNVMMGMTDEELDRVAEESLRRLEAEGYVQTVVREVEGMMVKTAETKPRKGPLSDEEAQRMLGL